ncbi:sulfide/dihydroorotate dehydrogenase-like FAD/NAD-binding protein [Clostridium beijerinckii]|uniref:Dihydroorotate dehydrogenase B, electron transfer subunit n=1 Tax=Clostridium beijerinckii TaxID=1520 RepID=A0A1S8T1X2_CLOBE|nr:sulfide/dihydroorotate dehydrogenase-like FAD/NAD-binding protein [Clostridium beijerinckii]MBA8935570.1 NAD(P)H-flavin reductase [Clostridium beijerinckii]NRT88330.1 NAD(P)H-flavin reductase [Clostridium beijerinckii]NRU39965.1 NAD(P)H-flavin reductase [Clostridium beijerinckii]NRY62812.1 NAD(P)H-flavin reductase [Clostridium beijerinckii]NSA96756.1 NAD(P)H-flavin reductase [Clostridium beijerinckii]
MVKEAIDCIDAGTEYCPCKLAEYGQCLTCSQCQGEVFCDCLNWKGVCIYQELHNNGNKAKEGRKTFECSVVEVQNYNDKLVIIKFRAPHKLVIDLVKPGSYVFIRTDGNNYFDVPISIMNSDIENDTIMVAVEIRGVKTAKLLDIKTGGNIVIRGPYWNGVFGIKNILAQKNNKTLVLARGIGLAPMIPVIRKLISQNNDIQIVIDKTPFEENFSKELLDEYKMEVSECSLLDKGKLSDHAKVLINDSIKGGTNFIHVAGADILTYGVINYLSDINRNDVSLSCCNNFKMCCGEGICGACTSRFSGHRVKRFCKEQADPRSIFEGRRFI